MRAGIVATHGHAPPAPDPSHLPMRSQLDGLAVGHRHSASFETRLWRSPGVGGTSNRLKPEGRTICAHRLGPWPLLGAPARVFTDETLCEAEAGLGRPPGEL